MARDFASIDAAKTSSTLAQQTSAIQALPPGYIEGFRMVLDNDYRVTIYAGTANIAGNQVSMPTQVLADTYWHSQKTGNGSGQLYYVYLTLQGAYYVDITKPQYNESYYYFELPGYGYRAIGVVFVSSTDDIIFAKATTGQLQRTVDVVSSDSSVISTNADYFCTGTDDQILIEAALIYIKEAFAGGEVHLGLGTFTLSAQILMQNKTRLSGSGAGTVLSVPTNLVGVRGLGTSGVHLDSIEVANMSITGTNIAHGVRMRYVDNVSINGMFITNAMGSDDLNGSAIMIADNSFAVVSGCFVKTTYLGIVVQSARAVISSNTVQTIRGTGIALISASEGTIVNGNVISDDDGNGTSIGINVYGVTRGLISNNSMDSLVWGIRVYGGTSTGVTLTANTVTNNSTVGIDITSSSTDALVTSNYAFNNGSDAGIANTNGDNFADAGATTRVGNNSWEAAYDDPQIVTNSYGWCIKFADGSGYQETVAVQITCSTGWGSLYYGSATQTWPVAPVSVIGQPAVHVSSLSGDNLAAPMYANNGSDLTTVGVHIFTVTSGNKAHATCSQWFLWK